ncbi:DUF4270 domain-containing protein [Tenacibaculum aiptasiae]|uniref:DUF4270 domain-containing protein n=1 Tax=Tenacibaculum aiptasiae TaxID=426481 RepID=A0A7J5APH8_9FLAO|nr:DUF4270 family protein [Tenacibaculum aiptasiae]KAB1158926.1 DUF4270 domain-containing protein [Tenacibaculum aiptasiae]
MIRKIGVLGISLLCLAAIISCEKDFSDIGSSLVNNTKFETGEILLDVEIITPTDDPALDLTSVRADNIAIPTGEYWLGVYKNDNYKSIQSSFVSQVTLNTNLKTKDVKPAVDNGDIDSIYVLDKVVLKLPYTATNIGKESDGKPKFRLDSLLGDPEIPTGLKVYRNGTFLNNLNPSNPALQNSFQSNHAYIESELLNEDPSFTFKPSPKDTMLVLTRNISNGNTYKDTIKLENKVPFLTVPLNTSRMKELFWDKFKDNEFSTVETFNNYFRGLIVKSEGSNGAMVPLRILGSNASATLDFHYTITTFEKKENQASLVLKDTLPRTYSFSLSGMRNSIYKMSPVVTPAPANNFNIQGTAGITANVKILDQTKLQELRANNWLINDASLTFYINQTINTDKNILPQRLFIYQNIDNGSGGFTPTQISDAHKEVALFGGNLELTDDKPDKYTFKITDYISDLLDNTTNDINPLTLKVYNNPTDNAFGSNNTLDTNVKTYNWNPRAVTLLDGNETANTTRRAVLKISYSKEK